MIEDPIQITIPAEWLEGLSLDEDELRAALRIGLNELRRRKAMADTEVYLTMLVSDNAD